MKRFAIGIVVLVALATLGLGLVGFSAWRALTVPVDVAATEPTLVRIEAGESVESVATELEEKQLIRSAFWFRAAARATDATLDVGMYHVRASETPLTILATLAAGDAAEVQVTLPEGWRSEEILDRLVSQEVLTDRAAFARAIQTVSTHPTLVERLKLTGTEPLEGFLFPDTYRFDVEGDVDTVVKRMVDTFLSRTDGLELSYKTVTLASIVEREAKHAEDRSAIAGVYANRLSLGVALEADPTVQYGKASRDQASCLLGSPTRKEECGLVNWWPAITAADYRSLASPYNTYLHAGLPPTPVCNPGLASLQAAANPARHDYLYFVTDADGKAHFAKTLTEHQANKAKYLQN